MKWIMRDHIILYNNGNALIDVMLLRSICVSWVLCVFSFIRPPFRLASSLSVLDMAQVTSSLSVRSMLRVGSGLSIFGMCRLGSTVSVLDCMQFWYVAALEGKIKSDQGLVANLNVPAHFLNCSSSTWVHNLHGRCRHLFWQKKLLDR